MLKSSLKFRQYLCSGRRKFLWAPSPSFSARNPSLVTNCLIDFQKTFLVWAPVCHISKILLVALWRRDAHAGLYGRGRCNVNDDVSNWKNNNRVFWSNDIFISSTCFTGLNWFLSALLWISQFTSAFSQSSVLNTFDANEKQVNRTVAMATRTLKK